MRVVLDLVICLFIFILFSCDDTVSVDDKDIINKKLFFKTEVMCEDTIINIGDTLRLPIDVEYDGDHQYYLTSSKGVLTKSIDTAFSHTFEFVPDTGDWGDNSIEFVVKTIADTGLAYLPDTFETVVSVSYSLVEIEPYDSTVLIGDTLRVPFKINPLDSFSSLEFKANLGKISENNILLPITEDFEYGTYAIALEVSNSENKTELYNIPFAIVKPLHFNREKMKYNKVVELGDSLIVPISVHSSGVEHFNISAKDYVVYIVKEQNNPETGVKDTMFSHFPTTEEFGEQEIQIMVYSGYDSLGVLIGDTFFIDYEVVYPTISLENNYSMRVGDTLLIPLKTKFSGENVSVMSSTGSIVNDSLFQFISNGSDEGVHDIEFTCTFSSGNTKTYNTSVHVLPFHELKVGDEWSYVNRSFCVSYTGRRSCSTSLKTHTITDLNENDDSMYVSYQQKSIVFDFKVGSDWVSIDTIKFGEEHIFDSTLAIAKNRSDVFTGKGTHFKSVVVKNYDFRLFENDSMANLIDGAQMGGMTKESFNRDVTSILPSFSTSYSHRWNYSNSGEEGSNFLTVMIPGVGIVFNGSGYWVNDGGSGNTIEKMISFNGEKIFDDSLDIDIMLEYLK